MSMSWEEVAELTGGEMVGGSLIVSTGHAARTSFGHMYEGQFVFTLEGLAFVKEHEASLVAPEGEPKSDPEDELVEAVEPEPEAVEEVAEVKSPSLEDLLG